MRYKKTKQDIKNLRHTLEECYNSLYSSKFEPDISKYGDKTLGKLIFEFRHHFTSLCMVVYEKTTSMINAHVKPAILPQKFSIALNHFMWFKKHQGHTLEDH